MAGAVRQWWTQPDHYEWMVDYLDHRGILTPYRGVAAAIVGCLGIVPVLMVASPAGPRGAWAHAASMVVAVLILAMSVTWMMRRTRRPSRVQSEVFVTISSGCIAALCLIQPVPLIGLLGCTAFAVLTTYISFFHTAPYMLVNFVAGAATTAVLMLRIVWSSGDVALAISAWIVLTALNLAVPLAVQSLLHALGMDLSTADRDPLTGLLNRRGFYRGTDKLVEHRRGDAAGRHLIVIAIDLDEFKRINDTRGHAAGDHALIAVADTIRRSCRHEAVIGRTGGDEFLIADVVHDRHLPGTAHRLRHAIASLPHGVTASVGTASETLDRIRADPQELVLAELIEKADDAMYRAKRAAGNRVAHHPPRTSAAQPNSAEHPAAPEPA